MATKRFKELAVTEKPEICPSCGFSPVGKIIYGLCDINQIQRCDIEEGSVILGGCCGLVEYKPQWACKRCGCEFYLKKL